MSKNIFDYMSEADYARYNEIIDAATARKAEAPKPARQARRPLTAEEKIAVAKKRAEKAQAMLDKLLAEQDAD